MVEVSNMLFSKLFACTLESSVVKNKIKNLLRTFFAHMEIVLIILPSNIIVTVDENQYPEIIKFDFFECIQWLEFHSHFYLIIIWYKPCQPLSTLHFTK